MARKPRAYTAGLFHFAAHGSDVRYLFPGDEDREDFLERLAVVCERFELGLVDYALLGSHYHTILAIPDERIAEALQRLHTEYSRNRNRRWGRSAHLFRAHPFARMIESDEDLVGATRFRTYSYSSTSSSPLTPARNSMTLASSVQPKRSTTRSRPPAL